MSDHRASLQDLVGDALRDTGDLARQEFALLRAEMADNLGKMVKGVVMFAAAAVFAVASLIWITQAIVYGLDLLLHRPWLSALIVGIALLLIAVVLVLVGKSRLSGATLAPTRSVKSLRRDGEVLSERTAG